MSLPNYLQKIKSAGIYRFVWDKSDIPGPDADILRLVVGYSEKGPFNTPVYIETETEFKKNFGGISKKLERYGVWFHRMAIQALAKGPILALNIKPFSTETVEAITVNPNDSIFAVNDEGELINKVKLAVEDIYNTNRFWFLEPEHLEEVEDLMIGKDGVGKYITITATDSTESSNTIFMRGYNPQGYDISFKEWYSSVLNGQEVPTYLQDFELQKLSQYFAEIYVFKGKFTPEIATSDKLAKFFDVNGQEVSLKPYILNAFGEKVDTLEALSQNSASNFIQSYAGILLPDFQSSSGSVISLDLLFNADYATHKMMMRLNQSMLYNEDITLKDLDTTGWIEALTSPKGMMSLEMLDPQVSKVSFEDGAWTYSKTDRAVNFYNYKLTDEIDMRLVDIDTTDAYSATFGPQIETLGLGEGDKFIAMHYEDEDGTVVENIDGRDDIHVVTDIATLVKIVANAWEADGSDGEYANESYTLTFDYPASWIINMKLNVDPDLTGMYWTEYDGDNTIIGTDPVNVEVPQMIKCISSVTATATGIKPLYLAGYDYTNKKPKSTKQNDKLVWQQEIMDTLLKYKGIRLALTNNTDIQYRYLVDTFEGFIEAECHSKLAIICKEKFNCLGLLNFPAMKSFSGCTYTSFKDSENKFDIAYIPKGGNRQKGITRPFSLVSEENGASFVSYNTPVVIQDSITGVKTTVPAAALVSNNFMEKYEKRYPYSIVAGPNYGRIITTGLIGPDFNFSRADLDILEPMGVNCMVYVPLKGTFINSNQTAKQNPVTTLSKINVRELVTFIQDEIEKLLQNYQWEFNTQTLRNTIKDRADVICETAKCNGGLYDYYNQCDQDNNTDDVINNEMLVLSTSIEPGLGAGKMVQELTLYRHGGMSAIIRE